ncbi:Small G protein signaling modulator 3 [Parelaphostrongylus tenuis]|uniref:Small G protein signaling modulator 3 n=1 Tax=Parelaphostrongylus tenuis TaxID=148309 RepID=A0AAD5QXM0_PARTN|nr:Small G protein signaling modulator 3 [Parelaphostrongylus tenuis]
MLNLLRPSLMMTMTMMMAVIVVYRRRVREECTKLLKRLISQFTPRLSLSIIRHFVLSIATFIPSYIEDPKEYFDEFGFRKGDDLSGQAEETIGIENTSHRMRFVAALEFSHSSLKEELVWSKVNVEALYTDRVQQLIKDGGIPHSMRPYLWPRFAGATKKRTSAGYSYNEVLRQSAQDKPSIGVQIERSLLRTLPNNICFWKKNSAGIDALRRVLKAVAFIYPDLGFCDGMG